MKARRLRSALMRETQEFAAEHPAALVSLWGEAVNVLSPDERMSLLFAVAKKVEECRAPAPCLRPIIEVEPIPAVITRASLELAVLMEPTKNDVLAGPRFVQTLASTATDWTRAAAIYAGLLLIGDRRVSPLLHQCWRRLDDAGRKILSTPDSEIVHAGTVDFFLDWLEDVPEDGWGRPAAALARLPNDARYPEVRDVEWRFPANKSSRQPNFRVLAAWTFREYGRRIAPRVRALMEREHEPKVLPLAAAVWGVIEEDDPTLQRGSFVGLLPYFIRAASAVQPDDEDVEKNEALSLVCGGSPGPGSDWNAVISLKQERRGYYTVWQTNARGRFVRRKRLCGAPPWRLLATYLANEENVWCIDVTFGVPEELGSSGLQAWQATALFLCWFRANYGRLNHGAEFRSLSDDEVQKVCKTYADRKDWRGPKVGELWDHLSKLSSLSEQDPAIRSTRLKDILDQLDCWKAPEPVSAAIELLETQAAVRADESRRRRELEAAEAKAREDRLYQLAQPRTPDSFPSEMTVDQLSESDLRSLKKWMQEELVLEEVVLGLCFQWGGLSGRAFSLFRISYKEPAGQKRTGFRKPYPTVMNAFMQAIPRIGSEL